MAENPMAVELRESVGKGPARKLRATGRIPGVYYGRGRSHSISLDPGALDRLLTSSSAGLNTLIDLVGGGELDGVQVLVKELQRDPVRGNLLHADLYAVDLQKAVHVSVPIHLTGTPTGVSLGGGILDQNMREIELECLPTAIPEEISIDVSELDLGQSLHIRDLTLPGGVTLLSDADLSIASVVAPAAAEEEAAPVEEGVEGEAADAAEGEGAEPKGDAPTEETTED